MRLKEINDSVAATCNVRASVVTAVQNETFRQIRAALDRGEKVVLAGFGSFVVKEAPAAEPGGQPKRIVRFREQREEGGPNAEKRREKQAGQKARAEAAGEEDD